MKLGFICDLSQDETSQSVSDDMYWVNSSIICSICHTLLITLYVVFRRKRRNTTVIVVHRRLRHHLVHLPVFSRGSRRTSDGRRRRLLHFQLSDQYRSRLSQIWFEFNFQIKRIVLYIQEKIIW